MWDTAGEERFRSLTPMYYKNAEAVLITFSLCSQISFENLNKWVQDVEEHGTLPNMMKILLGTKSDLIEEREVSQKEGEKLAKNNGFHYFETSAKEGTNVDQLF